MNLWGLPFKTIWILSCLGTVLGAVLYALAGLYLATVDGYDETVSYWWIPTNNHVPLAIERVIVTFGLQVWFQKNCRQGSVWEIEMLLKIPHSVGVIGEAKP